MPNTPQFVMAYFGILKAGGVVVATNPLYTPPEIAHQVSDAGIEIMFVMTNFYKTIKTAQPNTKIRKLIVTNLKETLPPLMSLLFTLAREKKGGFPDRGRLAGWRCLDEGPDRQPSDLRRGRRLQVGPDDTALFQYSGGTTGVSKGAVAMHRNVVANTLQLKTWFVSHGGWQGIAADGNPSLPCLRHGGRHAECHIARRHHGHDPECPRHPGCAGEY